jgi:hypothetical protein
MENEKSRDFYHEIINLVKKNVGTPAIQARALSVPAQDTKSNLLSPLRSMDIQYELFDPSLIQPNTAYA